jgi:hypothetical protein
MRAGRFARHFAGYSGAVTLVAIGGFTAACGNSATNNPTTATTTTIAPTTSAAATAPPPVAPTEKSLRMAGPIIPPGPGMPASTRTGRPPSSRQRHDADRHRYLV